MQKRNRTNRTDNERRIKGSIFVKKNGGMRFQWFERFYYWYLGGRSITRSIFRIAAAWQGVGLITSALTIGYIMSAFYTNAGEFVIRVDHPGEKKLVLSETTDFSEELITLKAKAVNDADNINIFDLDPTVAEVDGEHNGPDYLAYTFYAKNISFDPITYTYSLDIKRGTKGIEEAAWVMLYHNGKQQILAKESQSGGSESQFSEYEFPFYEDALYPQQYIYNKRTGVYELETRPFASSKVVATAQRDDIMPEEYDKFTVVIWLEGEDPECINDILGGTIELVMKFRY